MPCEKQILAMLGGEPIERICTHDGPCPFERIAELEGALKEVVRLEKTLREVAKEYDGCISIDQFNMGGVGAEVMRVVKQALAEG